MWEYTLHDQLSICTTCGSKGLDPVHMWDIAVVHLYYFVGVKDYIVLDPVVHMWE